MHWVYSPYSFLLCVPIEKKKRPSEFNVKVSMSLPSINCSV